MRLGTVFCISAVLACSSSSTPGPDGNPDAGSTPDAATVELGVRCGLDFEWIEPTSMGELVDVDLHRSSLNR